MQISLLMDVVEAMVYIADGLPVCAR